MSNINQKTLQYRQIDFLRLFRLCREMGIVRRKRKMPSQYDNESHVYSSCSKLFKSFLVGVFEELEVRVENRHTRYRIILTENVVRKLQFLNNRRTFLNSLDEHRDIISRLDDFSVCNDDGFITGITNNNYFLINVVPSVNGRYQSVVSETGTYNVTRPREEYYRCAKACLEYKDKFNKNIGVLCSFVDNHGAEIDRMISEQSRQANLRRIKSLEELRQEREEQQVNLREEEQRQREREVQARITIEEQARRAREESQNRAQQLFNQALALRRGGQI